MEAQSQTDYLPRGIRFVAEKANKMEPLPKGPSGRVVFMKGIYRSWGLVANYPPDRDFGSYSRDIALSAEIRSAESKDAIEWKEVSRCRIDTPGQSGFDGFTVFIDPKGDPGETYKAVYSAIPPKKEWPSLWEKYQRIHPRYRDVRLSANNIFCVYGAVSPDGINWKSIRKPLMIHLSDTDTTVYYDSWLDRYVMYTRLYWQQRRWVGRVEAEDFRRWGPVEPLLWPRLDGPPHDDIYTNARTEYPGLPQYHLMFPMIYHRFTQTSEVRLYSSADGICWNEIPGGAVLSPGAPGDWDSEFIWVSKDLVPLADDRVGILYRGTAYPHKYPRWKGVLGAGRAAWAWWPKGRLCAVVADEEGEFFTFPLIVAGRNLRLNVRTGRGGEARVGLAGVPNRSTADCDPLIGDSLSTLVRWKGEPEVGVKEGDKVILHFKLRAAKLFGFEWT